MNFIKRILCVFLSSLVVTLCFGCATTKIISVIDRSSIPKINKLLIVYDTDDLVIKDEMESKIAEEIISETKVKTAREIFVLPPLRNYTPEDVSNTLDKQSIDAVLIVRGKGAGRDITYYTYSSTKTVASSNPSGTGAVISTSSSSGSTAKYWEKNAAELVIPKTSAIVWKASTTTQGIGVLGEATMTQSFVRSLVDDLLSKGVLKEK